MSDEEPELEAYGVSTRVSHRGEAHILSIDWDGYDDPSEQVQERIERLPGLTLKLESSPGSVHYHNLTMRDADETLKLLTETKSDPMRTMMGYNWRPRRWVSRVSAKEWSEREGVETGPPKLLGIQWNSTDKLQSKGHYEVIGSFVADVPQELPFDVSWFETSPEVHKYRALSPEQKISQGHTDG